VVAQKRLVVWPLEAREREREAHWKARKAAENHAMARSKVNAN